MRSPSLSADGSPPRHSALDLADLLRLADANVTRELTAAECRCYLRPGAC